MLPTSTPGELFTSNCDKVDFFSAGVCVERQNVQSIKALY